MTPIRAAGVFLLWRRSARGALRPLLALAAQRRAGERRLRPFSDSRLRSPEPDPSCCCGDGRRELGAGVAFTPAPFSSRRYFMKAEITVEVLQREISLLRADVATLQRHYRTLQTQIHVEAPEPSQRVRGPYRRRLGPPPSSRAQQPT